MEQARDSISTTVTEIKETVANQVENVKDALDWREHFKKQPSPEQAGLLTLYRQAKYGDTVLAFYRQEVRSQEPEG